MSDLLQRARKARTLANDPSLMKWERATRALEAFGGLELNGLSRETRATLEAYLVELNRVLEKYPQATEDYQCVADGDLQWILDIIGELAAWTESARSATGPEAARIFRARFTNLHGDEWEFEYDPAKGEGVVRGSDVDWEAYRVVGGRADGLILNDQEILWLREK